MKYSVSIGGRTFDVGVHGDRVEVAGRSLDAHQVVVTGTPLRRLVIGGVTRTYSLERQPRGWIVGRGGERWAVEVVDERTQRLRALTGGSRARPSDGIVKAPMPGLVLRLEVEPGEEVAAGRGLLVLEAMKMENEIRAPASGVVRAVLVQPGQVVERGTELVEIAGSVPPSLDPPLPPG